MDLRRLEGDMDSRTLRRHFITGLHTGLRVVWPILSVLLGLIVVLGLVVGLVEGWSVQESIYFAFVSGLTIGYGDLAPKLLLTRVLAILIGVCGVLVTALVAAVAVKSFNAKSGGDGERSPNERAHAQGNAEPGPFETSLIPGNSAALPHRGW